MSNGWVIPLLFLNIFRLYGPLCFLQIPIFTSFNTAYDRTPLRPSEIPRKSELFVDFRCMRSKKLRRLDVGTFHTDVMASAVHAREFGITLSVYFSNLYCGQQMDDTTEEAVSCDFRIDGASATSSDTVKPEGGISDLVRITLAKTSQIESSSKLLQPSAEAVSADLDAILHLKTCDAGQAEDWSRTLMLKHALYNIFMSVDVPICKGESSGYDDVDRPDLDVSSIFSTYANIGHLGDLPNRYYQVLLNKNMFKPLERDEAPTVDDFMEIFRDTGESLQSDMDPQRIIKFVHRPVGDTFLHVSGSSGTNVKKTLNSTIRELRDSGKRLLDLGVVGIYITLRQFMSFGVSGSAAVQLFALVFPDSRFQAWSHYHMFICAFECDMERRDINSADRLLDLMLRWNCRPEPAMYARFFDLCASCGSYDLILKHGSAFMSDTSSATMTYANRFGLKPRNRVSLEMYFQLLSTYKRLDRNKEALMAFKSLLRDLQGIYRAITPKIWQLVRTIAYDCGIDPEFVALVEQCESISMTSGTSKALESYTREEGPRFWPVISRELESLVDRFVTMGLNGSGKSNVLLAVSFALAETLEHTNRDCYLYRGAESSEDDDFSSHVEVVFDVSHDPRVQSMVDNKDELRLKRIFSRSKDLYLVNGRQMSRKDYRQLIEGVNLIHFSKHSASYRNDLHFIVKQGAVGKICNLTAEERLSAFRDVIGHRSFDCKIEESLKLLQDYEVTFNSVEAQLSQIQRKLDSLDLQRGASEDWAALDGQRRVLQTRLLLHKISQLRENASSHEDAELELSDSMNALQGRIDMLEMDVSESRGALSIIESMDSLGVTTSDISKLESSLADVESNATALQKEIGLLTHSKGELEHEMSSLTTSIDSSTVDLNSVESDCITLTQRIQDLETQLSEVLHRQRNPGEKAQEMISRLKQKKEEAHALIKEIESQKATLSTSLTRCMNDQNLVHTEIGKLDELCQAKLSAVEECAASLETIIEKIRVKQNELSVNTTKQSSLRVQYSDAEKNFSKVALSQKTTLGLVKGWLESDDSQPHRNNYIGLLLDVLTVGDAFRVAVEQTLGAKLFTVVVRTMSSAKSLIRYLESSDTRYNNIRIVALEVFPAYKGGDGTAAAINVNREEAMPLIECVSFDEQLRPLVRSLLGDFCLVENADAASRMSHSRVNCVTPDGQVFYHRGTVSGGYVDIQESVLGLYCTMKQLGADLTAVDNHVADLNKELDLLNEEQLKLSQQHGAAKLERHNVQAQMRQMKMSLQHLKSQEESIREKLSDNRKERLLYQIKSWDEQIEIFERALSPSPTEVAELAAQQSSIESDLAELRRKKCMLEARTHELQDSISVLREKRNALAKRIITTIQMLEEYTDHRRELDAKAVSLRQSIETMGSDLLRSSEEREKARHRRDELCARLHKLESELAEQKAELVAVTSRHRELSQTLSGLKLEIKESEDELSRVDQSVLEEAQSSPVGDKDDLISQLAELNKKCSRFDLSSRGSEQESGALRAEFTELRERQERMSRSNAAIVKSIKALKSQKDANLVQMLAQLNEKLSATFEELVPGGRIRAVLLRREAAPRDISASVAVCLPECFVDSPEEETFTGLDLKVSFTAGSESLQQLYQLSGGQKTLVSLAFILAAQRLQAAPFYLLDEIDAALDEHYRVNVSRLLERQCHEGSQCILTTFRPELLRPGELFYEVCNEGGVSVARQVRMKDALSVIGRVCSTFGSMKVDGGGPAQSPASEPPTAGGDSSPVSGPDATDTEPIYYLYGDDVNWWQEEQVLPTKPPEVEWQHPPLYSDLQDAVHRLNDTHVVSPFRYRRYPHEYKSEAYDRYHEPASSDANNRTDVTRVASPETGKPPRRKVNIELRPIKAPESTSKPRKSLRERLRDGEVVFYEDYVEREVIRDFCRLFKRPFPVPRHDWGGGDFFYGEHVPSEVARKNETPAPVEADRLSEATVEPVEAPVKNQQVDALINADPNLTPEQRQELLKGEIVSLFSAIPAGAVRQRHPKDRLVSFHHLRTYACMIDSVTKCPLIHVELKSALQRGWLPEREIEKLHAKPRTKERPPDPYAVTPEQLAQAKEILVSRYKPKISQPRNINIMASRRQTAKKEAVQVGGGRYEV
ncbi:Structural maintenance of chromosomes protein 3 [Babesia sp. Xinjiang]|uniref:Structural maintenance of chromosomes protein 3 n=1 Tax=Babesia sp. Xinjiang TaxID=462227 RepID=UPI000A22A114|nr:Structural maintenance of chromosomes protein 3 [Babesia sp. Xinjiang]ORM41080.1 Structural maintenance of chromosomes protein 3 [Babesia sp. Xinjiang]